MGDAEAGASRGDEGQLFTGTGKSNLVLLFAVVMVIPGAVLLVRGITSREACGSSLEDCHGRCQNAYKDLVIVFQSQLLGLKRCNAICGEEADVCTAQTVGNVYCAAILGFGFAGATILVCGMDSIMNRASGNASLEVVRPRPAYEEPVYTEEEKRKMKLGGKRATDLLHVTVEAKCLTCNIMVDVDHRWLRAEMAGLEGAICSRCKRVVVGVL